MDLGRDAERTSGVIRNPAIQKKHCFSFISPFTKTQRNLYFVHSLKTNHNHHEKEMDIATKTDKHLLGKLRNVTPLRMSREEQKET